MTDGNEGKHVAEQNHLYYELGSNREEEIRKKEGIGAPCSPVRACIH
jgi:hypothetical protein